jgi:hypothetical protein
MVARGGRRGGRRSGTAGVKYPNRTDLQGAQLPPNAPTGLPYGDRAKLIAAQRAVPMGQQPAPAPPTNMGGAPPAPGAAAPPPAAAPVPGSLAFLGPTARPNEPVTAGIPRGPGPGPEVLTNNPQRANQSVANLLQQLAQAPGATTDVKALASYASANSATPSLPTVAPAPRR